MSPTISLHGHSAVHTSAGNAYDFGYDNPQFSDKILHILPERVCKTELHANAALQSSGPLLSMHINSLTLAANSDVFRRKLEDWNDDSAPRTLNIEVKPGEELYLQQLIRFCYTKQIEVKQEKSLLRLMQLADLFLVPECVQQCAAALTPVNGVLPLTSATRFLRIPEGLHSHEPFAQLVQRARSRLQAEFDDLDAVWANAELTVSKAQGPHQGVLEGSAEQPKFEVHHRKHRALDLMTAAAVFVAVSHWMQRASCKSKQASRMAEAAEKLAGCIRFPMLTNDFLHFVAAQAEWLPEEYRTGGAFRAATRFKGAGPVLQQQLADGSGLASQQYTPRRVGVGSTAGHMQWQVATSRVSNMTRSGPESQLRIPGEYYLCGFYWYLIVQFNSLGTSLGCYLHWTSKLNDAVEMSPPAAYVLASISLSVKRSVWGPDYVQVACMKSEQNFGGSLGMGWGNPFRVELEPQESEGELVRRLNLAGYVTEGFLDIQFTVNVRIDS